jgi:hypothetical protein
MGDGVGVGVAMRRGEGCIDSNRTPLITAHDQSIHHDG